MKLNAALVIAAFSSLVNAERDQDTTPNSSLLKACMADRGIDNPQDVKAALDQNADINTKDEKSGQTCLMAASLRGKIDIVKYLIEQGADASIGEMMGYKPPHGAAFQGRPDVMQAFIDSGIDVNEFHEDGFPPLHRTCWGKTEVSFCILRGAHITHVFIISNSYST